MAEGPDDWGRGWTALQQYIAKRGTAAVPARAVAAGVALGEWVESRRQDYWAGRLSAARVAELESLPGWSWAGRSQRRWSTRYEALRNYMADHAGGSLQPNTAAGKIRIGEWAIEQRQAHAAGNLPRSLADRFEALPGWRWEDDRWERGLAAVRAYLVREGDLTSVGGVEIDGFALGHWVQRCREDYRAGSLEHRQIDELESVPGWSWSGPDERWRQGLAALHAYYLRCGSAQPRQHAVVDGFPLGAWAHRRRQEYKRGTLAPERIAELESLPTWTWSTRSRQSEPGPSPGHSC